MVLHNYKYTPGLQLVSFPDPAVTKDKGLAHFNRNLGFPVTWLVRSKYIHDSECGLELKRRLGQGNLSVLQVQRMLHCSPVLEDSSLGES